MKTIRGNLALVLAGMVLGAVLSGPVVNAAEQIIAQRSTQRIYVDGRQTPMEAYSINGNNYVRLRDVGKAVGFGVSYDAADNVVRIDTTAPYSDDTAAQIPSAAGQGEILLCVPDVGDRIICDDGYVYEITDMSRYGTNVFQNTLKLSIDPLSVHTHLSFSLEFVLDCCEQHTRTDFQRFTDFEKSVERRLARSTLDGAQMRPANVCKTA